MLRSILPPVLFVTLLFAVAFTGCMEQQRVAKPENLIAEETYINLLVEFQILQIYEQQNPDTFNREAADKAVLAEYEVSAEQFRKSHDYYEQDLEAQIKRVEVAIDRIEQLQDSVSSNR